MSLNYNLTSNTISYDGAIYGGSIGQSATGYTYLDMGQRGYTRAFLRFFLGTLNTITFEATSSVINTDTSYTSTATSTDGTGATLVDSTLNTVEGFTANTDLIGCRIKILADATNPSNVNEIRTITAYTGASGTCTLDSALPAATTSSVTSYIIYDGIGQFNRRYADPTGAFWDDITDDLTKFSSIPFVSVDIAEVLIDKPIFYPRIRIKRVTGSGGANSLGISCVRYS